MATRLWSCVSLGTLSAKSPDEVPAGGRAREPRSPRRRAAALGPRALGSASWLRCQAGLGAGEKLPPADWIGVLPLWGRGGSTGSGKVPAGQGKGRSCGRGLWDGTRARPAWSQAVCRRAFLSVFLM